MFKVEIKRLSDNAITHAAKFESMEEANAWIAKQEAKPSQPWGIKASFEDQQFLVADAILGAEGDIVVPAVYETRSVMIDPGSYEIVITDVSAQIQQEVINQEALAYLASTDWMVTRAMERGEELSSEFKAQREAARASIVR